MLSDFDKKILNAIQEDIPLVSCPFAAIAERLHIDEAVLMERLTVLKEKDICADWAPILIQKQSDIGALLSRFVYRRHIWQTLFRM